MPEITEADEQAAAALYDRLPLGDHTEARRYIAQALAEQREALSTVDLYDEPGDIDVSYGSPKGIGDDFPSLIAYTLTLPSGHVFRLSPWQARELMRETRLALGENGGDL